MVPSSSMILPLPPVFCDGPVRDALAFQDEIGADERQIVLAALGDRLIEVAVDREYRDAGLLGVQHGGRQRLLLARREEDEIDALGDHAVDVGDLLGGGARGVGVDELAAALGGLVLHARGLGEAPGIVALGLGEADLVGILLLQRRDLSEGRDDSEGCGARRPDQHVSACNEHVDFLLLRERAFMRVVTALFTVRFSGREAVPRGDKAAPCLRA